MQKSSSKSSHVINIDPACIRITELDKPTRIIESLQSLLKELLMNAIIEGNVYEEKN